MHYRQIFQVPPWGQPAGTTVGMTEAGLVLGRSVLARFGESADQTQSSWRHTDETRCLALLSVAAGHPVSSARMRPPIEAAAKHWQQADKALANLRLAFANLPQLHDPADADRLALAENLLDAGMSPDALMAELWPDQLGKHNYNRDQPRVPAGSDRGGQWSGGSSPGARPIRVARKVPPLDEDEKTYEERRRTGQTTFEEDAAEGRPLDPMGPLPPGIGPGPYAVKSVPAGPSPKPTIPQKLEVDANGRMYGCHRCGTRDPGTPSGRFYCDHQRPSAANAAGTPQVYLPHCLKCSCAQGGLLRSYRRNQK